eukprot:SAG31_NODE_141_length_22675_cov_48.948879_8_plen_251_part_00
MTQVLDSRVTERSRFYLIDYYYCQELYQKKVFLPYWIDTTNNGADIYTKAVSRQIMDRLRPRETVYSAMALPTPDTDARPSDGIVHAIYAHESPYPVTRKVTSTNTVAYSGGCEEPQNDGGGVPGTKISGTAGTAGTTGTAMYPDSVGTAGTAGTGPPTGTADTALYPDPDTAGISRMATCTAGEVGTSTDLYEKSLDTQVHLGHGMGPREHGNTSSALPRRDQGLLRTHRPGIKPMDTARFKFCAAGVT